MQSFRRFDRSSTLLIGLLTVSFLLATFDVRGEGAGIGDTMRDAAQSVFSPLQKLAVAVTRPIVGFIDGVSNIAGLREENERLRTENEQLRALAADAEELQNRVEELEKIAKLDAPAELTAVAARIVANGPTDFDQVRFIDKGSADGVVRGQAVIDENGLVGRIDLVSEHSARVRLLTDPRLGVGVRDLESNETGWVEGRGGDETLRLEMFSASEDVEEGDLIVTDGSRFPPGIVVGRVAETATGEAGFALFADVIPSVEFSRIDFVKVIVGWSPLDASAEPVEEQTVVPEGEELP
jgi:rod shape-determining protein MreC